MRLRIGESDNVVLSAIAILLENKGDVGVYYKSLDIDQKKNFDTFPMLKLI